MKEFEQDTMKRVKEIGLINIKEVCILGWSEILDLKE